MFRSRQHKELGVKVMQHIANQSDDFGISIKYYTASLTSADRSAGAVISGRKPMQPPAYHSRLAALNATILLRFELVQLSQLRVHSIKIRGSPGDRLLGHGDGRHGRCEDDW
jgi:hypothetical protein